MEDLKLEIEELKLQVHSLFESLNELQRLNIFLLKKLKEMEEFWYED